MNGRERRLANPSHEELRAFSLDYPSDFDGLGHANTGNNAPDGCVPLNDFVYRGGQRRRHEHE